MKGKKLLASMLSAAMVLSSMSFTALADEVMQEENRGGVASHSIEPTSSTVTSENAVAQVGETYYETIKAAIKATENGDTVKLVNNIVLDKVSPFYTSGNNEYYSAITISKDKKITLDLNGHNIKWSDDAKKASDGEGKTGNYDIFWLSEGSELKIVGNGVIDGDVGNSSRWARIFFAKKGSNLIIDSGEFYAQQVILFNTDNGASATINGGKFGVSESYDNSGVENIINANGKNVLEKIYGGTFLGVDPRCFEDGSSALGDGCKVSRDGDTYTVLSADTEVAANVFVPKEKLLGYAQSRNIGDYAYTTVEGAKKLADKVFGKDNYAEVEMNGVHNIYATVYDAFEDTQDGDTITLLNDVEFDKEVVIDKDITIDFNNKKVTVKSDWDKNTYPTLFRVYSNVTVKNGNMETSTTSNQGAFCFMVGKLIDNKINYGSLVIENGTYKAYNTVAQASYGTIEVLGGDFSITPWIQNEETENYEFMFNCLDAPYKNGECGIEIKGGTFAKFNPSNNAAEGKNTDFVADGFKAVAGNNDSFKVIKIESDIVETASTSSVTVQLDDLYKNEKIDVSEDVTYEVVVSNVSTDDKAKVDEVANIAIENGQSVLAYDIKVVKIKDGKREEVKVENQQVTITLPNAVPENERNNIKIYHIDSTGASTEITTPITVSEDGTKITFTAPSFSAYVVTYNAATVTAEEVTDNITVAFEQVATKQNEYDIVLKAESGKKINGLTTADLTFALIQGTNGVVSYEIQPAANINLLNPSENRYEFNFDGINAHNATAENITIGKVVFGGYCTGANFAIATADTNIVHTTKTENSIVDKYTVGGATNELIVSAAINPLTIEEEKKTLTINVDFPNAVIDNAAAYQDMKINISSANSNEDIALGNDMTTDGKYVVTRDLVKNTTYTVTVSGAGYRTARYTVTMTNDKTLNFWNNVKDSAANVEENNTASAKTTTFLAGELVNDGKINIYDLSAVVSYFGTNATDAERATAWNYAKYDLNRDGKIDSRDIAYVLVSWGK